MSTDVKYINKDLLKQKKKNNLESILLWSYNKSNKNIAKIFR